MKKIKVQLDFNISKKIHSLYHSFFNNPPKGVEYQRSGFRGINDNTYPILGKTRKIILKIFPFGKIFERKIIHLLRKETGADLIHFTFHLGDTRKPSVIDYESAYNFVDVKDKSSKKVKERMIAKLNAPNIKFLMPINEEARKSFKIFFGEKIQKTQQIIYPTIFIPEKYRQPVLRKKKIVFVSTSNILDEKVFFIKGGPDTLYAFEHLSKKYPAYEFVILGKVPKRFINNFPKNMTLIESVSREKMWEMFNESEIFVQPSYQFPAMAFIEAMFFKLPIVTYNGWANSEYVDSSNGILIEPLPTKHVDENNVPDYTLEVLDKIERNAKSNSNLICKAIEKLMSNPNLRKKLGQNGFRRVTSGKFSIKKKNEKLRKIYEYALKNN